MHSLPQLSYGYDALEPHFDAQTMELHHSKHHQTYVDKLNAALESHVELAAMPLEELLKKTKSLPEDVQTPVRNHGGGHSNHSLWWEILTPGGAQEPSGELAAAIDEKFGSFEAFKTEFTTKATTHFGSGWCWLAWGADEGLHIHALPNQESPFEHQHYPVMGLDVWEHAYYLKYQNRRPEFINAFWNVLNWDKVAERFAKKS